MAAAQHWRWRQCGGGSVSSVQWRQAAVRWQCSPLSSLMMKILCGGVGGGDEDTGSNSDGGGTTNSQQSTKSGSGNGNGNNDNNDTLKVSNGSSGSSLAAAQHWRQRQCGGGNVSSARWQRAAVLWQCSPSSSLMMNILCSAVVMGAGMYYDVFDLSRYKLLSGQK